MKIVKNIPSEELNGKQKLIIETLCNAGHKVKSVEVVDDVKTYIIISTGIITLRVYPRIGCRIDFKSNNNFSFDLSARQRARILKFRKEAVITHTPYFDYAIGLTYKQFNSMINYLY